MNGTECTAREQAFAAGFDDGVNAHAVTLPSDETLRKAFVAGRSRRRFLEAGRNRTADAAWREACAWAILEGGNFAAAEEAVRANGATLDIVAGEVAASHTRRVVGILREWAAGVDQGAPFTAIV